MLQFNCVVIVDSVTQAFVLGIRLKKDKVRVHHQEIHWAHTVTRVAAAFDYVYRVDEMLQ